MRYETTTAAPASNRGLILSELARENRARAFLYRDLQTLRRELRELSHEDIEARLAGILETHVG